jgi:NADPH:quinone reductase-like Zn-dependent oxidoreductase
VVYGEGLADRLRSLAPGGIDTIIDFEGARRHGAKTDASTQASTPEVLAVMAEHVAWGRLTVPIAAIYPLGQVREAYTELAGGHVHGKIVLSTEIAAGTQPLRG